MTQDRQAAGQIPVLIPGFALAMKKLDEANPSLNHAAGHQALAAEGFRSRVIEPVELPGGFRFPGEIDQLRGRGLHLEGHFIGGDSRFELSGVGPLPGVPLVQPFQQVELAALAFRGSPGSRVQIDNGIGARTEESALVGGRQETLAPLGSAAHRGSPLSQHDKAGQILILASQTIGHPCPDGRSAGKDLARQGMIDGRSVIAAVDRDTVEKGHVVDTGRQVRQQFRHPPAGLTMSGEAEGGRDDAVVGGSEAGHVQVGPADGGHLLPCKLVEGRPVFEGIHLAHSTFHEEKDAVFGLGRQVSRLGQQRISRPNRPRRPDWLPEDPSGPGCRGPDKRSSETPCGKLEGSWWNPREGTFGSGQMEAILP